MRYFIIGGAGFIGSHFAKYLVNGGDKVSVYDNLSTGRRHNLDGIDYRWENDLVAGIRECDYIIHLAASVGVDYVNEHPYRTMLNNIDMERRVFHVNSTYKKPLLFASTSEVYGNSLVVPYKEDAKLSIGDPTNGRWGYACSKLMGEFLSIHSDFPSVVVRFFNVTGRGQLPDYGMVLPNFVRKSCCGENLVVYGDGSQVRCFCDVRDAVIAMKLLVENPKCYGQVFNIGNTENKISMKRLAEKVIQITESSSDIEYKPLRNENDIEYRVPDTSKILEFIKWRPSIQLDDIIKDMSYVHTNINE